MEEWRDVPGYEGIYQVSSLGRVKIMIYKYNRKEKIKSPFRDKDGYLKVKLTKNKKANNYFVHRIIAVAFIPNSENKPQVNHINGTKDDNRVENLEWCTLSENRRHAYDTGLQKGLPEEKNPMWDKHGTESGHHKLTEEKVITIRELYSTGEYSQTKLGEMFNTSQLNISWIIRRKTWKHI